MRKTVYSRESEVVAKAIADERRRRGLKQEDVAAKVGWDQSAISNIERGQRRIDVIEFYNIAKAIGSDPKSLFHAVVTAWEAY